MSHEYDDLIDERGVSTKTSLPRQADLARTRPAELLGNPQRLKLLQGFRDWLPRRAQDKAGGVYCSLLLDAEDIILLDEAGLISGAVSAP